MVELEGDIVAPSVFITPEAQGVAITQSGAMFLSGGELTIVSGGVLFQISASAVEI